MFPEQTKTFRLLVKLLLSVLLFHSRELFDLVSNTLILNASVDFILSSKNFEGPLM